MKIEGINIEALKKSIEISELLEKASNAGLPEETLSIIKKELEYVLMSVNNESFKEYELKLANSYNPKKK